VLTGKQAAEITSEGVRLASDEFIAAEMVVWAAGIKAPDFLKGLDGLPNRSIKSHPALESANGLDQQLAHPAMTFVGFMTRAPVNANVERRYPDGWW
jgi:hypothetical protein